MEGMSTHILWRAATARLWLGVTVLLVSVMGMAVECGAAAIVDGQVSPADEWASATVFPDNYLLLEPANPDYDLTQFYLYNGATALYLRWQVAGTPVDKVGANVVNYAIQFDLNNDGLADFWITRNTADGTVIGETQVAAERDPFGTPTVAATLGTFAVDTGAATPAAEAMIPYSALVELGYTMPLADIKVLAVIDGSDWDNDDVSAWEDMTEIPEPATMSLMGLGLLGLFLRRKR